VQSEHILPARPIESLDEYTDRGGGAGLDAARRLGAAATIDEVDASGLRGRGGAGFPTGRKWRSIVSGGPEVGERFAVANGAEGEPGSFKDRMLLRRNPYQVLEGLQIAARSVGARHAYLALKESFVRECDALDRAFAELADAGLIDVPLTIVRGPEEYLFGEEKALLEVVEGEDPLPRWFPPYIHGLFTTLPQMGWSAHMEDADGDPGLAASNPTLVNNVETLAHVAAVLARGADWYRTMGTGGSPGPTLVTVSGDTARAGVGEVEMGTPLADVIAELGGGMPPGRNVQAVLSGVANPVLTADQLERPMTYEDLEAVGSGIGACGFIVYDDTRDMVAVAHSVSRFLAVESCGQCPPCKWGTGEITRILDRMLRGRGAPDDLSLIAARLEKVTDGNRCTLGLQERIVVQSMLASFPEQVDRLLDGGATTVPELPAQKLVDITDDGTAVLDERQWRKRSDWTYADAPSVRA
jgi:NADH:ubiquinone oxidoreductase subunit F (NADH-binding)